MDFGIFSVLGLSLLLGLKHALEPDHVIGVATVSSQKKNLRESLKSAFWWGTGHTITIAVVTLIIFLIGNTELGDSPLFTWFERGVGVMLIVLGIKLFIDIIRGKKLHTHSDDDHEHSHTIKGRTDFQSAIIGGVHGLAGSGAVVVAMGAELEGFGQYLTYIILFGIGSVLGMMIATGAISLPIISSKGGHVSDKVARIVMILAAVISILFGAYLLWELR